MSADDGAPTPQVIEKQVRDLLAAVYLPAGINLWLSVPNPRLPGSLSPNTAIAIGLGERVLDLARSLTGDLNA